MSLPALNLDMDLQGIKQNNARRIGIGNVVDFEKYKKLDKKLQFLKKFAKYINNNKLVVSLLVQLELELIKLASFYFSETVDINDNVKIFKAEFLNIIDITDFLLIQSAKYPRVVKINQNELDTFSFIKKRFYEVFRNQEDDKFVIPNYLLDYLKHHRVEIDNGVRYIIPNSRLCSDENSTKRVISFFPDLFLGDIYYFYNSFDPNFIDDRVVYFINLKFSEFSKKLSEDKIYEMKRGFIFKKINLRYSEVLEQLA